MPPRKKAKASAASAASTPLRDTQPKTPQDSGLAQLHDDLLNDPWADEQETQLMKSMMKWKPTGMHKHFRIISIHTDMRSHGFASDDAPHTRIPGIWKKLWQLYDLDALDTRENEFAFAEEPDPLNPEDAALMPEFELPEDEFGEMMWLRRFHRESSAAASSPAMVPVDEYKDLYAPGIGLLNDLPDSVRSQKAESVAEATPTPRNAKGAKGARTAKTGKGTKAGANTAKNTKAQSTVSESAEEEDEHDDDEESSVESEQDSAPITRRANRAKPKAAPKRTRKR
ncbi:CT20 family protein [Pyrenophora tritici-repentis]|uniref:CT20 family protein n=2 Tax=Pyrenophora tritici-repentis TaxID=45151 RepID=A0A922N863_9PLEO|nr:CT20 family protein [Pyrenophora tritici-repentis Pt-1C-BFP]EDU48005.1 CT20 family protein [Pyrenophora tritici-repentis Pt-1C-BFP]KAI1510180.1 CT20 family protein [Pyrenophora tritici-repentis]KAI1668651.1 CT20 family protein [Pyrenophora tritici-repentis]KAI1680527.1 CT20 family protein [Pyrenophora tritici-repentis]